MLLTPVRPALTSYPLAQAYHYSQPAKAITSPDIRFGGLGFARTSGLLATALTALLGLSNTSRAQETHETVGGVQVSRTPNAKTDGFDVTITVPNNFDGTARFGFPGGKITGKIEKDGKLLGIIVADCQNKQHIVDDAKLLAPPTLPVGEKETFDVLDNQGKPVAPGKSGFDVNGDGVVDFVVVGSGQRKSPPPVVAKPQSAKPVGKALQPNIFKTDFAGTQVTIQPSAHEGTSYVQKNRTMSTDQGLTNGGIDLPDHITIKVPADFTGEQLSEVSRLLIGERDRFTVKDAQDKPLSPIGLKIEGSTQTFAFDLNGDGTPDLEVIR